MLRVFEVQRMRIGFLSYFNLQAGEGYEHWLSDVSSKLNDHEIYIVTSDKGPRRWDTKGCFEKAQIHEISFKKAIVNRFSKDYRVLNTLFNDVDLLYTLFFTYNRMSLILDFLVASAQLTHDLPVIAGHHNPHDWFSVRTGVLAKLGVAVGKVISSHHVLNEDARLDLVAQGVKRVFKVPNGVATQSYTPREKKDAFKILYVGTLEERKGVNLLPFAVAKLKRTIKEFELIVVGEGELEHVVRQMSANGYVKWLGFVNETNKRELYSTSHVFLAPSKRETFMLTGLEAMASGTPVVTFDIPGPREYVVNGYNGFLVRSLEEMVEKVNKLYSLWKSGSQEYWEMCKNARKTAERFDWAVIIPKLEHMFHTVVKEHGNNQMQSH
ncbi:hypothetical protein B9Q12_01585 [Candidatus Marsarchaeota G2 archaeon ECH_B_SAG-G06]|uniref:Glycosyl transferase family 1 domain-containing protein n=1 Tax=Candidatus Marsarchaeota G2 archaeon ECH_B_SAG-G06 TaxID=1978166 RepID=A0A2R6C203_9ARCH|nr:MAG: hypothetical protein B9Q12_01585 [Candidatus Marsarchaeota G2 archaeon ECH_B_SAG-G06]